MNDLTFGATLLSFLAMLIVAVIVESTAPPATSTTPGLAGDTAKPTAVIAKSPADKQFVALSGQPTR